MDCTLSRETLEKYLDGGLSPVDSAAVEKHVETCAHCQRLDVVAAEFATLVRRKAPREAASAELHARVRASVSAAPEASDAATKLAEVVDIRGHWYRRALASPWTPRVALLATLLFLFFVPFHLIFQAPALAKSANDRHACHAPTFGTTPVPPCCTDLMLRVGDALDAPSDGKSVPDLSPLGLDLVTATRCTFDNVVVNQMGYQDGDSHRFSLYISDQVTEQFMQLRVESVDGVRRTLYRFDENEVTIWERDGLVYFWVGPRANPMYDTALDMLMNVN